MIEVLLERSGIGWKIKKIAEGTPDVVPPDDGEKVAMRSRGTRHAAEKDVV